MQDPIDFPVAWNWHRHYQGYFYGTDPGPNEIAPETLEIIDWQERTRNIPNDHIVALVTDLQNRLNRHIDASRRKDRL